MNSEHVITGWIAQLNLDGRDRDATGSRRSARPEVEAAPAPAIAGVSPGRPRAARRPFQVWARDGRRRAAVGGPCLGLG